MYCNSHISQSALLKYWDFQPTLKDEDKDSSTKASSSRVKGAKKDNDMKAARAVDNGSSGSQRTVSPLESNPGPSVPAQRTGSTETIQDDQESTEQAPTKLIPVIFFDESHRLPLLIRDRKAMKCILDAMLVLTKQVCCIRRLLDLRADRFTLGPPNTRCPRHFGSLLHALATAAQHYAASQNHVNRRCIKSGGPALLPGEPAAGCTGAVEERTGFQGDL